MKIGHLADFLVPYIQITLMKMFIRILGVLTFTAILVFGSSCSRRSTIVVSSGTATRTNLPPGQAKKVYGGSAKDYAPGQQKKKGGTTVIVKNK